VPHATSEPEESVLTKESWEPLVAPKLYLSMNNTRSMIVLSVLGFLVGYVVLWLLGLFSGLGTHGTIAAILGAFLASVIGVGLMALIFYSNRSHHDRDIYEQSRDRRRK
jgi:Co/Zn/Cd efflux system component